MKKPTNHIQAKHRFEQLSKVAKQCGFWSIKVTALTFGVCLLSSVLSNLATAKNNFFLAITLLLSMIFISIIFDAIGVAVAACNYTELIRTCKINRQKDCMIFEWISCNAEKVNNICCDVVGDMCGILSGACGVTIVVNLCVGNLNSYIISIIVSSLIAAITVGGKAFFKGLALSKSHKFVTLLKNFLKIFWRKKLNK